MSAPVLSQDAKAAFSYSFNVKYLATTGPDGAPNLVPIISLSPFDDSTLVFGQIMLKKTRANLDAGRSKVGIMVADQQLRIFAGVGDFSGFSESGLELDMLNSLDWMRYNAYTGFKAAGKIAVKEMRRIGSFSKLGVLAGQGLMPGNDALRRAQNEGPVPPAVIKKFLKLKAVKAYAYVGGDGWPRVHPASAVGFPDVDEIRVKPACPGPGVVPRRGDCVAVAVITLDPVAYQLKGEVTSSRRWEFTARITRAYSASPPLPGEDLTAIRIADGLARAD